MTDTPSPAALEQRLREALAEEYKADWPHGYPLAFVVANATHDTKQTMPILLRALARAGLVLAEGRGE
jgi:hypothetical protein